MTRLEKFKSLKDHAWYYNVYKKLTKEELQIAIKFCVDNEKLNNNDFATKAVRLFLDVKNKPKNWTVIEELLIASL